MRKLLYGLITLQTLLGLWFISQYLVAGDKDWNVLAIFFYSYIAHAAIFVIAGVTAWLKPPLRKLCFVAMAMPFAILIIAIIPPAVRGTFFTVPELIGLVVFVALGGLVYVISRKRQANPNWVSELLRSRVANWMVLLAIFLGWLVPIGVMLTFLGSVEETGGAAAFYILLFFGMAAAAIAAVSLIGLAWAIVCLRILPVGSPRGLNIAQCIFSMPGLLIVPPLTWLYFQSVS